SPRARFDRYLRPVRRRTPDDDQTGHRTRSRRAIAMTFIPPPPSTGDYGDFYEGYVSRVRAEPDILALLEQQPAYIATLAALGDDAAASPPAPRRMVREADHRPPLRFRARLRLPSSPHLAWRLHSHRRLRTGRVRRRRQRQRPPSRRTHRR